MSERAATALPRIPRSSARSGFLWHHLVGGYSLWRSYWLHTVLLGWDLAFAGGWALSALADRLTARAVSIAVLVVEPILLLVWVWSMTGTTVSALRKLFAGAGPAVLALLVMVLSALAGVDEMRRLGWALKERVAIARGKQPTKSFAVHLSDDGRLIEFSGGVNDGAAASIDQAIGAASKVGTLLIDSPGGWMREGRRMAEVVKRFGLNTRVEHECFSACTLALLAGENRSAGPAALIGFHRARAVGRSAKEPAPAPLEETDIYRKAGLHDAFVRRIVSTPNDSIWIPTRRELLHEDVLTR